jgi:hypothetical protein
MNNKICLKYVAAALATVFMLPQFTPALAQSPPTRESLEQMFSQIAERSKWDMSGEMLWGYFFTNQHRQPLELAAKALTKRGYRLVNIYLSDKDKPGDPDLWWLHVERVEHHSVDSLDRRNHELTTFAKNAGLKSYDGMDVGPAIGRAK